jgi:hypothetical protein
VLDQLCPRQLNYHTNLRYRGTAEEIMAFPKPQMILPMIIMAKAVWPRAPVCTAAPTQVRTVPTRAVYLLPIRSLAAPEMKIYEVHVPR